MTQEAGARLGLRKQEAGRSSDKMAALMQPGTRPALFVVLQTSEGLVREPLRGQFTLRVDMGGKCF